MEASMGMRMIINDQSMNGSPVHIRCNKNCVTRSGKRSGHFFRGHPLQTKLMINEPGDFFEAEADRVAETVMGKPGVGSQSFFPPTISASVVQRSYSLQEQDRTLSNQLASSPVTPAVEQTLSSPGDAMDTGTRRLMELRFGRDFSQVKIHNDSSAHQSSAEIQARAYTNGKHIAFGSGHYQPGSKYGKKLLAHELVHVVQQQNSSSHLVQRNFNFLQPTPVKSINPVTVKYNQDKGSGFRSLGLTTATFNGSKTVNVGALGRLLNFRLSGVEDPPGTFTCQAVCAGNVDVSAEELILVSNRQNKWTGRFPDYPNTHCERKTNIPVTIEGDPDAVAVEERVLKNEDEHVSDTKQAVTDINARITAIERHRGSGNSEAACTTNLLRKTGQDPARTIANAMRTRLAADVATRDSGSHTLATTRDLPNDCARIKFTYKA
jgi:hypothetical protein